MPAPPAGMCVYGGGERGWGRGVEEGREQRGRGNKRVVLRVKL